MNDTRNKIRQFIIDNFLFGDAEGLEDNTSFLEGGIIDSTGVLELIRFLEEEYSIQVDDEELIPENLDSINNLLMFLNNKKAVQQAQ